ncbi:MAG: PKD domain-containing protein [Dehalococcoidia bacterium]
METKRRIIIGGIAIAVCLPVILWLVVANRPPVIDSLEADAERVFRGGSTQIACTVSARDGAALNYDWWAEGGEIDGEGATVVWKAPDAQGFYNIMVTVSDGRGHEVQDHVMIIVKDNQPPIIYSVTAGEDWTTPGGSLNLTCDAEDYDGHPLSYNWSVGAGQIDGTGPEVTWTAPGGMGIYEITVVVSDDYGGSATSTLAVSVMPDQPPKVEALIVTKDRYEHCYLIEYDWGYKVGKGQKYDVECVVSDSGVEVSYAWSCDGGEISEISEDGSMMTWIAPNTATYVRVTVIVSDIAGNTAPPTSVALDVVGCSPCTFRDCG